MLKEIEAEIDNGVKAICEEYPLTTPAAELYRKPGDEPIPVDKIGQGALFYRTLPDGLEIIVWPMSYGKARLCIGPQETGTWDDAYCYDWPRRAIEAARVWTGEGDPLEGWTRHFGTGRRREGGDPTKETVRW